MSCWAQNLEFQKSVTHSHMEGGTDALEFEEEIALLVAANNNMKVNTVCQTGFNTGISAFAFLCALQHVHVHSFDIGAHSYVSRYNKSLEKHYPTRHTLHIGDSTKTLPTSINCDFVFVDGGHSKKVATHDINSFANMTTAGRTLIVENCNVWGLINGFGGISAVNEAYKHAVQMRVLKHVKHISTGNCVSGSKVDCREMCVSTVTPLHRNSLAFSRKTRPESVDTSRF